MNIISADEAKKIVEFYDKKAVDDHLKHVEGLIVSASKNRRAKISVSKSGEYDSFFWERIIEIWRTLGYRVEETPTLYTLFW